MLYNGVIRSATVVVIDMVAVTRIIKPQRASIFGELHTYEAETFSAVDRIWNRKNMRRYSNPSHFANQTLGPQHCEVFPFFHAFKGCYVVSSMFGIGKKTA